MNINSDYETPSENANISNYDILNKNNQVNASSLHVTSDEPNLEQNYDHYSQKVSQIVYSKNLSVEEKLSQLVEVHDKFISSIARSKLSDTEKQQISFKADGEYQEANQAIWQQKFASYTQEIDSILKARIKEEQKEKKLKDLEEKFRQEIDHAQLSEGSKQELYAVLHKQSGETTYKKWSQKLSNYNDSIDYIMSNLNLTEAERDQKLIDAQREFSYSVAGSPLSEEDKTKFYKAIYQKFQSVVQKIWTQKFDDFVYQLSNVLYGDSIKSREDQDKFLMDITREFSYSVSCSTLLTEEQRQELYQRLDVKYEDSKATLLQTQSAGANKNWKLWNQKFDDYVYQLSNVLYGDSLISKEERKAHLLSIASEFSYTVACDPSLTEEQRQELYQRLDDKYEEAKATLSGINEAFYDKNLKVWDLPFEDFTYQLSKILYGSPSLTRDDMLEKLRDVTREFSYSVSVAQLRESDRTKLYDRITEKFFEAQYKLVQQNFKYYNQQAEKTLKDPNLSIDEKLARLQEYGRESSYFASKTDLNENEKAKLFNEAHENYLKATRSLLDQHIHSYTQNLDSLLKNPSLNADQKLAKLQGFDRETSYFVSKTDLSEEEKGKLYDAIHTKYLDATRSLLKQNFEVFTQELHKILQNPALSEAQRKELLVSTNRETSYFVSKTDLSEEEKMQWYNEIYQKFLEMTEAK